MKRFLSMALVLALSFALLPTGIVGLQVCAETVDSLPYLTYTITDNKVTITDCDTSFSGELVIPSAIENYPVTAIGSYAFEGCVGITAVTIPAGVNHCGMYAFSGCVNLQSVHISDLSQWCAINFDPRRCESGCCYVDFTANPLSYGADLYVNGELVTELVIPPDVKKISKFAFYGCNSLTSVIFPDTDVIALEKAFGNCANITMVAFGRGDWSEPMDENSYLDYGVFSGCYNIADVWCRDYLSAWEHLEYLFGIPLDSVAFHSLTCVSAEGVSAEHRYSNSADTRCDACDFRRDLNGWVFDSGKWAYYQYDSKTYLEWMKDSYGWVYLGADGYMKTNAWVRDSVGWCYVGSDGYCVKNRWQKDSHGWCYLGADGRVVKNVWVRDTVSWCYVDGDGYCVTDQWKRDSKGWVYLGANGRMVTNQWFRDVSGWLYLGADGYIKTNAWQKDSRGWCYLDGNGRMVTNTYVRDSRGLCYINTAGYWDGRYR